jgi:hypothetical protein
MICEHKNLIGDNYGVSCQGCGQVLEGYGLGGFFSRKLQGDVPCIHGAWYPINDTQEECMYCHITRKIQKPVSQLS